MELTHNIAGDCIRFVISGAIDRKGADHLKEEFAALGVTKFKTVVFDFAQVSHIGSAGLGKLLLFYKQLSVAGVALRIERASHEMLQLLKELKLDTLFPIS